MTSNSQSYIIVCCDRSTGRLEIYDDGGVKYFDVAEAERRQKQWSGDYPHMTYVVVRIKPEAPPKVVNTPFGRGAGKAAP